MSLCSWILSAMSQLCPKPRHRFHLRRILSPRGDQCHLNQHSLDRNQAKVAFANNHSSHCLLSQDSHCSCMSCMFIFIFLVFCFKFLQWLSLETPQEKCGISMWTVLVLAIVAWHWTEALHQIWGTRTIVSFCSANTSCCFKNLQMACYVNFVYKSTFVFWRGSNFCQPIFCWFLSTQKTCRVYIIQLAGVLPSTSLHQTMVQCGSFVHYMAPW